MIICRILFCLLLISYYHATGQYCSNYTTSNGLVSNDVYQVCCDRKGYIWFCTDKGVVRYNGRDFETFTIANGLTDNEVYNCYEDLQGRIWFYSFNGAFCYFKNDSFYNSSNDQLLNKLHEYSYLNFIYEHKVDSSLYFGHIYGPIQKLKDQSIQIIEPGIAPYNKLRTISSTRHGGLRVTSLLDDFLLVNDSIYRQTRHELQDSYFFNDRLIVANDDGVSLYNGDSIVWQMKDSSVRFGNILHLFYDGKGYIFCGTRKGLTVYNIHTGEKRLFFDNIRITSSRMDLDGNYWISTFGHGVFRFSKVNLTDIQPIKNVKGYDLIKSSSGQIFLKKLDSVQILTKNPTSIQFEQLKFSIPENAAPVFYDKNVLYYYDHVNGGQSYSVNNISGIRKRIPYRFFKAFKIGENDVMLFNSNDLIRTNFINGQIDQYTYAFFAERLNTQTYIKELNSVFFINGKNILYRYTLSNYQADVIDTIDNIGSSNYIYYEDDKIYILTNNGQKYIYDATTNRRLGSCEGKTVVYDANKIGNNKFLANTDKGYHILRTEGCVSSFDNIQYPFHQKDIMFMSTFYNYIVCKVGDEFYSFLPDILNKQKNKPRLYIKGITINKKIFKDIPEDIETTDRANLDVALSPVYYGGDDLIYRYRITEDATLPGEWEWHYTQGDHLNFSFASQGEYKIEVQVAEKYGEFSDSKTIFLTIVPSFIHSSAFLLICLVLIIIIVVLIIRFVHQKRKAAFAKEMNFLKLEHRATSALLNPHFIFNAINNIQNLINQNSKELASEYLATLSTMIRQNLDNLQYYLISLAKEIELIENYIELQNLRFNQKVNFELKNEVQKGCLIPPLLIQTFVENAIVHGYDKQQENFNIQVSILYTIDDYLIITISDNGRGVDSFYKNKSTNKSSLGISFTDKRLRRLSGFWKTDYKLQIEDISKRKPGQSGTEVVIEVYAKMKNTMPQEKS